MHHLPKHAPGLSMEIFPRWHWTGFDWAMPCFKKYIWCSKNTLDTSIHYVKTYHRLSLLVIIGIFHSYFCEKFQNSEPGSQSDHILLTNRVLVPLPTTCERIFTSYISPIISTCVTIKWLIIRHFPTKQEATSDCDTYHTNIHCLIFCTTQRNMRPARTSGGERGEKNLR